jgi:hypothetical protein
MNRVLNYHPKVRLFGVRAGRRLHWPCTRPRVQRIQVLFLPSHSWVKPVRVSEPAKRMAFIGRK